jgi:preprotein translocase subunit SecE
MGKKAGTFKAKKSKAQGVKVKTGAEQEKDLAPEAPEAPNRTQSLVRLDKGGGKSQPESPRKVQAVPGKGKEAAKLVKKEPGKPLVQFFKDAVKFLQGAWFELKKVHWPTRSELVIYTIVVIGSVVFVSLLIWVIDSILSQLMEYIL